MRITAWEIEKRSESVKQRELEMHEPKDNEVLLEVEYCGLCRSDIAMIDNHWWKSTYPFSPGHEIVGKITKVGTNVSKELVGQRRGLGWISGSCGHCRYCWGGEANLCDSIEETIVGRSGGLATHVLAQQDWTIPIPDEMDSASACPLLCAGTTVFSPFVQHNISPLSHIAVVGIGGLGHIALQIAKAWGCEVTAFTTTPEKINDAFEFGAHNALPLDQLKEIKGRYDLIINTTEQTLGSLNVLNALAKKGILHQLGVTLEPLPLKTYELISKTTSVSGSQSSDPTITSEMLIFCARHKIIPKIELMPISKANTAIKRLREGDVRYRFVLKIPTTS